MPLHLTPLENLLARLSLLPVPLFDMPLGAGIAKALVTACEMGLFDALSQHALPLNVLAGRLNCDPNGLELLLNLLVSAGYLHERKGYYRNTRAAQRWLTTTSPFTIAPYILHSPDIVDIWNHMPEVVRTNRAVMRMPYDEKNETLEEQARLARHYAGLAALATMLGREITLRVHLPRGATALLDVGGSHAAYSALFCRRYPHLHATILDIPAGLEAGKRTAMMMHLEERMSFVVADIVKENFAADVGQQFDVALYFHIAHLLQPTINQAVLAKGFTRVMSMLNRKQLPVCARCHRSIHEGTYDGLSLRDFAYDPREASLIRQPQVKAKAMNDKINIPSPSKDR